MRYTLDRFEGDMAVLVGIEDGSVLELLKKELSDAKEGDVLVRHEDGTLEHDARESEQREKKLRERFERLKKS